MTESATTDRGALGAMKALDLIMRKGPPPMACCPRCTDPTPLIGTCAFARAEFYCLECGGHFGFLAPRAAEATPELDKHYDTLKAEWDEHAGAKLRTPGSDEYKSALAWLKGRQSS